MVDGCCFEIEEFYVNKNCYEDEFLIMVFIER